MAPPAVRVRGLTKQFGGVEALRGVEFAVEPGEIFGLVGPNGAGKTTTLRTLATLLDPGGGTVEVRGIDVTAEPNRVRESLRYLPEEAGAYENYTGRDYLEFVATFYADDPGSIVERGVAMADLDERIDDKTGGYSKGMTRKLLVASALMTEPGLAILDEPTSGLDVRNARRVREIVTDYPDDHRSVLLSSHDMLEVANLCDRVALLAEGRIVARGSPAELMAEYEADTLEAAFLEATA
jgi:ABC-2 type transport system ATP-binding protein